MFTTVSKLQNFLVPLGLLFLMSACASREVAQLNQSVSDLDMRMQRYQQDSKRDTNQTSSSLNEVNQAISNSFHEIRSSQTNLETMMEQVNLRLSKVEQELEQSRDRSDRMNKQVTDNYAELSGKVTQVKSDAEQNLKQDFGSVREDVKKLSAAVTSLSSAQTRLENRFNSVESSNRQIYEKILKELGAAPPETKKEVSKKEPARQPSKPTVKEVTREITREPANTAGKEESYSGRIHIVEPGETLSIIVTKYKVSMKALKELNGLTDSNLVQIGRKLRIPEP